jgi:hypothetical protein
MSQISVLEHSGLDSSGCSSDDSFGGAISDWLAEKESASTKCLHKYSDDDKENMMLSPNSSVNVSQGNIGLYKDRNVSSSGIDLRTVMIPDSEYICEHLAEFSALCEVQDLDFESKACKSRRPSCAQWRCGLSLRESTSSKWAILLPQTFTSLWQTKRLAQQRMLR